MKADELAFLNRQLAGMLKDGLPLEGALRGAARELGSGKLRGELEALEADLAAGMPLGAAIDRRAFPPVYRKLVRVGAASGDLAGALVAAADHFESAALLGRRMQAVMVYPACVLGVVLVLSVLVASLSGMVTRELIGVTGTAVAAGASGLAWALPVMLGAMALGVVVLRFVPAWRHRVAWMLPVSRDGRVARVADTLSVLVAQGCPLPEAVGLLGALESGTPLGRELEHWGDRMRAGASRFADIAEGPGGVSLFPPLFRWLVAQSGSRVADGLAAASRFYAARARHRVDLILHGALPASMMFVGLLVVLLFLPAVAQISTWLDFLGSDGGGW